jgi:pseudaminic acid biosynthesis-associated methylase
MNKKHKTSQEEFWASKEWAKNYIERNDSVEIIKSNIKMFSDIFSRCEGDINSMIEFGSNIGLNLHAIKTLMPNIDISTIEINDLAVEELKKIEFINKIYHQSILEFTPEEKKDFVLIKGVLIHINPDFLQDVYEKLYESSSKYILVCEYYNPTPVTINYRGHNDRLFKRDFAGELMDKYRDLKLVDYKFTYHRDSQFPQDDSTWFLLEKLSS